MRKLLVGRFVWDVKFQENFLPFVSQESHDLYENFVVNNATRLFNSAYCLNLGVTSHLLVFLALSSILP